MSRAVPGSARPSPPPPPPAPPPPVPAAEDDLRDLLAGPEAVEDRAAGEAAVPQGVVDAAAEVGLQVGARRSGGLVDGEVGGAGERQGDAAEAGATRAVGPQLGGEGHRPSVRNHPASARPSSCGESSGTKWEPGTVTSVSAGHVRTTERGRPTRRNPGSALTNSFGTSLCASHCP